MSDEREKRPQGETEDVEAHKMNRMGEAEDKRDKIAATDEGGDDVEGHMLGEKHSAGKHSPGKHSAG
jgi:hypothetical protein